jgi:predicted RNase H-like nuclease (RuvC/YqgF family)
LHLLFWQPTTQWHKFHPKQQAALAKATGATKAAAAHVHRAVETLAQGTLKGASFGFESSEFIGEIALEENKKLTETKEKYKDKKAKYNKDKRRHDYLETTSKNLTNARKLKLKKLKEKLPNDKLEVQNLEREVAKLKYENPLFET